MTGCGEGISTGQVRGVVGLIGQVVDAELKYDGGFEWDGATDTVTIPSLLTAETRKKVLAVQRNPGNGFEWDGATDIISVTVSIPSSFAAETRGKVVDAIGVAKLTFEKEGPVPCKAVITVTRRVLKQALSKNQTTSVGSSASGRSGDTEVLPRSKGLSFG